MEAQLERLQEMSETLESSGFSTIQTNAVIKSVALAMRAFAVTPEVLDQRIDKVMDAVKEQGDEIKDLNKSMNRLEHTMNENHRSALRYTMMFAIIVTAALGAIVTVITQSPS